jgi:hypothetical protein
MRSVTVLLSSLIDSILKQTAAAQGSSIESVVNSALSDYLKINYPGVNRTASHRDAPEASIRIGDIDLNPARRQLRKMGVLIRLYTRGVRSSALFDGARRLADSSRATFSRGLGNGIQQ